jgi:hypothetical protein
MSHFIVPFYATLTLLAFLKSCLEKNFLVVLHLQHFLNLLGRQEPFLHLCSNLGHQILPGVSTTGAISTYVS